MKIFKVVLLSAISIPLLTLSSCAVSPKLVPSGEFSTGQTLKLDRDWSDYSPLQGVFLPKTKVRFLTIDGLHLNRLYVSEGLSEKDVLFQKRMFENKAIPLLHPNVDMTLLEQIEFVAKSINELDYIKISTSSPKSIIVSGEKGVRFQLEMQTKDGLKIRGIAQAVKKNNLNYYIVYLAPAVYYFDKYATSVVISMDSAIIK